MIGVLFATEMEAQPFREQCGASDVVIAISGMGLAAARAATLDLLETHGVDFVINAGVCGALKDEMGRGDLFCVDETFGVDQAACRVKPALKLTLSPKKLVSVDEPVFQPDRKAALARFADLVDMEGHAVAQVCAEKGIPCLLIKGVTDFGDHHGKGDIQAHIRPVSHTVAQVVCDALCTRREHTSSMLKKLHSFTKIEHTIFSLPLLFAGAWLGAGGCPSIKTLALIALVGFGARTFGMAANRILDRDIDAKNPRTKNRELPSGKLSMKQGYGVAVVGLAVYFLGCFLLGSMVFKLSLLPLIPLSVYSLLKRFTPLCHYGIGICLAAAPIGAFVAVTNSLVFPPQVWLLALFTFCWISGFDIIYALLDLDFDRANGVRSLPAAIGAIPAQVVAAITHLLAIAALRGLVDGWWSGIAAEMAYAAFIAAYLPFVPIPVRFFPISAIAGIAGACVVLF